MRCEKRLSANRAGRTRLSGPTNATFDVSRLSKPASMSLRAGSREFTPNDAYALSADVNRSVAPTFGFKNVQAIELGAMSAFASGV